jgi:glycine cleavage system H protein
LEFPSDLKYSKDHEWLSLEGTIGTVGITDYAQGELGDIVFVELPATGAEVQAGAPFGTIEAVKAVSDLLAPVAGKIVEINEALEDNPMAVNEQPYSDGWMVKIELINPEEIDKLISADEYRALVE